MNIERYGTLSAADSKRSIPIRFTVTASVEWLEIDFVYAPIRARDSEWSNQISLSLFDPYRYRGTRHNNTSSRIFISTDTATPGFMVGNIPAGEWIAYLDAHRIIGADTVSYEIHVVSESRSRWYTGNLHAHTIHSDGKWDVSDLVRYALEEGHDFTALTDHNTVSGLGALGTTTAGREMSGRGRVTDPGSHSGSRQWTTEHLSIGGRPVRSASLTDTPAVIGGMERKEYYAADILGSIRTVMDETGAITHKRRYDAFGETMAAPTVEGDPELAAPVVTTSLAFGYTGKPEDPVTGLLDYGFRDYAPETGRFTTSDPIRDGVNWYAYVDNDPMNKVDRWGLREAYSATTDTADVPETNHQWPTTGTVSSEYGPRDPIPYTNADGETAYTSDFHNGIDIANSAGTPVTASAQGTVTTASTGTSSSYGNYVVVEHPNGESTTYAHLAGC